MAITRYAGDRFTIADGETKPTGVLDGAYLIDTGNLTQFVRRTVGGSSQWTSIAGGGGGGSPGGSNTQVQFNDNGVFGATTGLTFDGQRLYANNFQLSGILYDSNASVGEGGMVLANEGTTGVHWKSIESVLSGVGGSGVANYVARWSDEDTLTTGALVDDGTEVGIGTATPAYPLQIQKDEGAAADFQTNLDIKRGWSAGSATDRYVGLIISDNNSVQAGIYANRMASHANYSSDLVFYTNAGSSNMTPATALTERMIIKADGKVGIGTPTPDDILDVTTTNGQLLASDYGVLKLIRGTAGDYGSALQFIKSDNGGAVTDGAILGSVRFFGHDGIDTATEGAQIASIINGTPSANVNPTDIVFKTASTGNDDLAEKVRIMSNGNVGIGTTAPAGRLHIETTGNEKSLWIAPSAATTTNVLHLEADSLTTGSAVYIHSNNYNTGTRKLVYINNDHASATGTTALYINQDSTGPALVTMGGNVGIGIAAPGYKTQIVSPSLTWGTSINDDSAALSVVKGYQDGANDSDVNVARFASVRASYGATADWAGHISLFTNAGVTDGSEGTEKARITWDGNNRLYFGRSTDKVLTVQTAGGNYVGIGTDEPEHHLHVSGDAIISGVLYDSTNSSGVSGHVLTSEVGGPQWKMIEDVLSGVGGNGTATYIPQWIDSDTIGDSVMAQSGSYIGIGTDAPIVSLSVESKGASDGIALYDSNGDRRFIAFTSGGTDGMAKLKMYDENDVETIRLNTNGNDTFFNGGNVGIGTTNPGKTLDVDGDIRIRGDSGTLSFYRDTSPSDIAYIKYLNGTSRLDIAANNKAIVFMNENGPAESMRITSAGSVGIGTNAPAMDLHVVGTAETNVHYEQYSNFALEDAEARMQIIADDGGTGGALLCFSLAPATGNNKHWIIHHAGPTASNNLEFGYMTSAATDFDANGMVPDMVITTAGDVGIGTDAPGSKLTVNQSGGAGEVSALSLIHSRTGTPANGDAVSIEMRGDFWTGSAANERVMASIRATVEDVTNGAPKGKLAFATLDTTGAITDKVTILSDGNVGIGTTAPTSWLQVLKDNNNSGNQFSVADSEGASAAVRTYTHGGDPEALILNHYYAVSGSGNEYMRYSDIVSNIGNGAGTTIRFITKNAANTYSTTVIDNNGKVGIGTTAPGFMLQVDEGTTATYAASIRNANDNLQLKLGTTTGALLNIQGSKISDDAAYDINLQADGGQVGIGTNNPGYRLDVYETVANIAIFRSTITSYARVVIRAGATGDAQLTFQNNTASKWTIGNDGGDSDKFKIEAGGGAFGTSPLVCILSGGNFGIGTNAPAVKLHVVGSTVKIERTGNAPALHLYNNASNPADGAALGYVSFMGTDNDGTANQTYANIGGHCETNTDTNVTGYLTFNTTRAGTAVTEQMRIISGTAQMRGQLGLGCTPHQYAKLHTRTDGTDNELRIEAYRNDVGQTSIRGYFSRGSAASPVIVQDNDTIFELQGWAGDGTDHHRVAEIDFQVDGTPGNNDMPGRLVFGTTADGASAPTEQMRIQSDGNVGIGTIAPSVKLEVYDATDHCALQLSTAGTNKNVDLVLRPTGTGTAFIDYGVAAGSDLTFYSRKTGAGNVVTIKGDGKVGIGTMTPDFNLQANATNGGVIGVTRTAGSTTGVLGNIRFGNTDIDSNLANVKGIQDGATDSAKLVFQTQATGGATTERMRIASGGAITFNNAFTFPTADGTAGYHLQTDGAGAVTWQPGGAGTVTSVTAGNGMTQSGTSTINPTLDVVGGTGLTAAANAINLDNTAVTPASYTATNLTVDQQGRITAASSGAANPTAANPSATVGPTATNGSAATFMRSDAAPALANTAVTAASYTYASITVDDQGRLTAASSGTAPGGGTVTGTGTDNYIPRWNGTTAIQDSVLFYANDDGNVGVGTADPKAPLHVFSNGSASTQETILCLGSNTSNRPLLQFSESQNAALADGMSIEYNGTGAGGANKLVINKTGGTEMVAFLNSGNVGIGISPSTILHAVLDSAATNTPTDVLRLGHTSTGSTAVGFGALIRFDAERTGTTTDGMGRLGFVADVMNASRVDGAFIVQTGLDGSYTERMRIASDGDVGIGTNAPSAMLDVVTSASSTVWAAEINQSNTSNGDGLFVNIGSTASADYVLSCRSNSANLFDIKGDGNVGINDATPSYKLDVNGTFRVTGASVLGTISSDFDPTTNSTYSLGENTNRWANIFADTLYGAGSNITALNASALGTGTVPTARLGSGTADSSTFLRGDNTWVANASGTVTSIGITPGTGLDVSNSPITTSGNITVSLDLNELGQAGILAGTDCLVVLDGTDTKKETISGINLSIFNNNSGWTSNAGTVTSVGAGTGLTISSGSGSVDPTLATKLDELTDMSDPVVGGTDQLILLDNGTDSRKTIDTIYLGQFNNDQGWTSNAGDITSVGAALGLSGGGTSGSVSLALDLSELDATTEPTTSDTFAFDNSGTPRRYAAGNIPLSIFENDNAWTSNAGTVTSVTAGTGMTQSGTSTINPTLNVIGGTGITANANDIALTNTAVTAASYTYASITVDAQGRLTAASSGTAPGGGTVTSIIAGDGLSGGTITTSGTIANTDKGSSQNIFKKVRTSNSVGTQIGLSTANDNDDTIDFRQGTGITLGTSGDVVTITATNTTAGTVTSGGSAGYIPRLSTATNLEDSIIFQETGKILLNGTTALGPFGSDEWAPTFQQLDTQGIASVRCENGSVWGGSLHLASSNGTLASPTAAANGDRAGAVYFSANDGTDFKNYVGAIECFLDGVVAANDTPGRLVFSTAEDGANTLTEQMRIEADGKVGIGTNNPLAGFDVYSTSTDPVIVRSTNTSRATLSIRSGSTGDAQVRFQNAASSKWTIGNDGGDSDKFKIAVGSGAFVASEALIVDTSGNLSILGTLTEASSLAIKENVETYSPSLEMISKIRPVRFNKKKSKKKEVGLVAEELAEMFPELVETDEKGNPSGVNYSRAVAVLLHGFKELYKEVKELKEKI